jgi:hypothetical protein
MSYSASTIEPVLNGSVTVTIIPPFQASFLRLFSKRLLETKTTQVEEDYSTLSTSTLNYSKKIYMEEIVMKDYNEKMNSSLFPYDETDQAIFRYLINSDYENITLPPKEVFHGLSLGEFRKGTPEISDDEFEGF